MRLDAIVQARLEVGSLRQTSNFRLEPKGPGLYQHGTMDPLRLTLGRTEYAHWLFVLHTSFLKLPALLASSHLPSICNAYTSTYSVNF